MRSMFRTVFHPRQGAVFLPSFLRSESGATTVDWVVLSAALIGLGLAALAQVGGGVEDVSSDVRDCMKIQGTILDAELPYHRRLEITSKICGTL